MLDKAGFTGARMTDEANHLPLRNFKTDMIKGLLFKRSAHAVNMREINNTDVCHLSLPQSFGYFFCAGMHVKRGKRKRKTETV